MDRRPAARAPARPASRRARRRPLRSTTIRSVDMQIWPWWKNAPKLAAAAARSRSASRSTIIGALPPSSSSTRFRCRPAFSAMIRPTLVEPVKLIRRVAGWAISSSTTSSASTGAFVTRLITPGRQSGVDERVDDGRVSARAELGGLQDDRVRVRQRRRDRASGEDHRRVPRRDPDDDAGRAPGRPSRACRGRRRGSPRRPGRTPAPPPRAASRPRARR